MAGKTDPVLTEMFDALSRSRKEILPSKFWKKLSNKNFRQLEEHDYRNFKRTVALNYFTWIMNVRSPQLRFLRRNLPPSSQCRALLRAVLSRRHKNISWKGHTALTWKLSVIYNFYTYLLWEYATRHAGRVLAGLQEPREGNPFRLYVDGRLISQDLANSALEFDSIMRGTGHKKLGTIFELGAGYGRNAYVFLKLVPGVRYVVVDIPPALYVAQRYLSSVFPEKKVFKFREFKRYSEIKREFEDSDIAFLLPGQMELLPGKSADLFITISSLQEMRPEQIRYYFGEIGRLTRGHFYFKQWKSWKNPIDNVVIAEKDYPVGKKWRKVYWRECRVQTEFFEALFKI